MDAWEDLVYDDDILESFLKKCDSSSSLIPDPAGNVQAVMLNRINTKGKKSTQKFANDVAKATYERDFTSNAWKWDEMFIEHHGLVTEGKMKNINALKEAKGMDILPVVACLIKECKSNGLGDMQLTVKDPSHTMKASVHHIVIQDPKFGDNIRVGSVMILNLVKSFCAFRPNHYLNIVHRNVVKVFPPEISPPLAELVKETPKPVIRLPMWAENNVNVDAILRKFVRPTDQPSTSSNQPPTDQPSTSANQAK
ncbi:uncharacterized protein C17orf53 homolog [Vigna radiata var. radiata]|uniref:Uncharacterized protein C17orf53 homolog n=1 Tax=Vigna radiata var. radiata TaxID=3916 RepID=A0A1S3T7R5_VIGRR|nr:uncharacterized protein C17orf53 homolog [Vigna radiata var. radiata]